MESTGHSVLFNTIYIRALLCDHFIFSCEFCFHLFVNLISIWKWLNYDLSMWWNIMQPLKCLQQEMLINEMNKTQSIYSIIQLHMSEQGLIKAQETCQILNMVFFYVGWDHVRGFFFLLYFLNLLQCHCMRNNFI